MSTQSEVAPASTGLASAEDLRRELADLRRRVVSLEEAAAVLADGILAGAEHAAATTGVHDRLTRIVERIVTELFDTPDDDGSDAAEDDDTACPRLLAVHLPAASGGGDDPLGVG